MLCCDATTAGNAIVNFARVVPDGLLVFFPSYGGLNECIAHWQNTPGGVWDRITKLKQVLPHQNQFGYPSIHSFSCNVNVLRSVSVRQPVVEPRGGGNVEFQSALDDFDQKLRDPNIKGAVFFAVMRGKVSRSVCS